MLEWDILNYLKKWRTNLRATIMTYIEASFKIDLGDYYRTYLAMRERKRDRTPFLNNLIQKLLRKMDEDDNI